MTGETTAVTIGSVVPIRISPAVGSETKEPHHRGGSLVPVRLIGVAREGRGLQDLEGDPAVLGPGPELRC